MQRTVSILLGFLVGLGLLGRARAQEASAPPAAPPPALALAAPPSEAALDLELRRSDDLFARGARKKAVGKGFLVAGGVLAAAAIVGGLELAYGSCDKDIDKCPNLILGGYTMVFGALGAVTSGAVGGVLYQLGASDQNEALRLRPQISVSPLAGRSGLGGGALNLAFRF